MFAAPMRAIIQGNVRLTGRIYFPPRCGRMTLNLFSAFGDVSALRQPVAS